MNEVECIIEKLQQLGSEKNREGMARFGINTEKAFGVSVTELRKLGRSYKKRHDLALELWQTGYHEARILAAIIDDPTQVTPEQMDSWMQDFNSWDLCDQTCALFDKTPYAVTKIKEWTKLESEFQKRAGFALLAELAWHAKAEPDETFEKLFPLIEREAWDERNYVKKAVNWALRQIGKRNENLRQQAIVVAERIEQQDSQAARWIARDALRGLRTKE